MKTSFLKSAAGFALLASISATVPFSAANARMATNGHPVAEIAQQANATDVIKELAANAVNGLTDPSLTDEQRKENFVSLMKKYFQMDVVSRFVLGRYWRSASKEEMNEFSGLLLNYLAQNYASQFKDFKGDNFVVNDEVQQKNDTFVNSQFLRSDGPPVHISWRMREFDGQYKIIDVSIEGLSMGITQRDEFTAVIQKNGDKVSALIDALKSKS